MFVCFPQPPSATLLARRRPCRARTRTRLARQHVCADVRMGCRDSDPAQIVGDPFKRHPCSHILLHQKAPASRRAASMRILSTCSRRFNTRTTSAYLCLDGLRLNIQEARIHPGVLRGVMFLPLEQPTTISLSIFMGGGLWSAPCGVSNPGGPNGPASHPRLGRKPFLTDAQPWQPAAAWRHWPPLVVSDRFPWFGVVWGVWGGGIHLQLRIPCTF